eukprot:COSAG02_NODE_1435_length_12610_cov_7.021181_2_plen_950_part_00
MQPNYHTVIILINIMSSASRRVCNCTSGWSGATHAVHVAQTMRVQLLLTSLAALARAVSTVEWSHELAAQGPREQVCAPYLHWLSQPVAPGETIVAVGWCHGQNATLLLDGHRRLPLLHGITGSSVSQAAASMAVLPSDVAPGNHTIGVVTASGDVSNTMVLNAADLWWVQGDEGAAATAGGWIRAFGRGMRPAPHVNTAEEEPQTPAGLVRDLSRLATGWDADGHLAQLRAMAARYPDWFKGAAAAGGSRTPDEVAILVLTPLGGGAAVTVRPSTTDSLPKGDSSHSLTFPIPAAVSPGEYSVVLQGPGGSRSALDFFDCPSIPRVRAVTIRAAAATTSHHPDEPTVIWVDGPSGINMTAATTHREPYGTAGDGRPVNATPALLAALSRAASLSGGVTVRLRAGYWHIDGPIVVPDGVTIAGSGAGLTALYLAYDNTSTAPHALISPVAANASWGLEDLTIYVLGFHYSVIQAPADVSRIGRFRMSRVVVRADAFHCQLVGGGQPGTRSPPWFVPGNTQCGTQSIDWEGGYQSSVVRLGRCVDVPAWAKHPASPAPCEGDVSTGPIDTPAPNVQVVDCDLSGSWHLFEGRAVYFVARSNKLWHGQSAFSLIARQAIVEGNDAVGSSITSGSTYFAFSQQLFFGGNRIRHVRGSDREAFATDGADTVYYGAPSTLNATHVTAPSCPGIADSRFEGNTVAGSQIMVVAGPGTGQYRRVVRYGRGESDSYSSDSMVIAQRNCWWELDKPFEGLAGASNRNITIVVAAFTGRNLLIGNTLEDAGPILLYHTGVHNVVADNTMRRTEGAWSVGMDVPWYFPNHTSSNQLAPNPQYFNEFTGNTVAVGHRAPHQPNLQNRDTFWNDVIEASQCKSGFSMGISGQGFHPASNRFQIFRRNEIVGGNGLSVFGVGNTDVLVERNLFVHTNVSIALDFYPQNNSAVQHVVVRNNTVG